MRSRNSEYIYGTPKPVERFYFFTTMMKCPTCKGYLQRKGDKKKIYKCERCGYEKGEK